VQEYARISKSYYNAVHNYLGPQKGHPKKGLPKRAPKRAFLGGPFW